MPNKNELRHSLLQQRQALSPLILDNHSEQVSLSFFQLDLYKQCQTLAVYFACKNEISTQLIIKKAQQDHKKVYLPVIQNELLDFYSYQLGDPLIDNRYAIPEPNTMQQTSIDPRKLDVMLLPCTACDIKGHRIGSGCGYYDRTLAFKHHSDKKKPTLICLAHDFQKLENIETDAWDVNVDIVLTEKNCIQIG